MSERLLTSTAAEGPACPTIRPLRAFPRTWAGGQPAVRAARRLARGAMETRRRSFRGLLAVGILPVPLLFFLALTQDPHRLVGETTYGPVSAILVFGVGAALAGGTCALAAVRENRAMAELRAAVEFLTPWQAAALADELTQVAADEHPEVLNVVLARRGELPSELLPALPPWGGAREPAALEERVG